MPIASYFLSNLPNVKVVHTHTPVCTDICITVIINKDCLSIVKNRQNALVHTLKRRLLLTYLPAMQVIIIITTYIS